MSDDDAQQTLRLAALATLGQMDPFLEYLRGMCAAIEREGFTPDQARAIVASTFGWRSPDPPESAP